MLTSLGDRSQKQFKFYKKPTVCVMASKGIVIIISYSISAFVMLPCAIFAKDGIPALFDTTAEEAPALAWYGIIVTFSAMTSLSGRLNANLISSVLVDRPSNVFRVITNALTFNMNSRNLLSIRRFPVFAYYKHNRDIPWWQKGMEGVFFGLCEITFIFSGIGHIAQTYETANVLSFLVPERAVIGYLALTAANITVGNKAINDILDVLAAMRDKTNRRKYLINLLNLAKQTINEQSVADPGKLVKELALCGQASYEHEVQLFFAILSKYHDLENIKRLIKSTSIRKRIERCGGYLGMLLGGAYGLPLIFTAENSLQYIRRFLPWPLSNICDIPGWMVGVLSCIGNFPLTLKGGYDLGCILTSFLYSILTCDIKNLCKKMLTPEKIVNFFISSVISTGFVLRFAGLIKKNPPDFMPTQLLIWLEIFPAFAFSLLGVRVFIKHLTEWVTASLYGKKLNNLQENSANAHSCCNGVTKALVNVMSEKIDTISAKIARMPDRKLKKNNLDLVEHLVNVDTRKKTLFSFFGDCNELCRNKRQAWRYGGKSLGASIQAKEKMFKCGIM